MKDSMYNKLDRILTIAYTIIVACCLVVLLFLLYRLFLSLLASCILLGVQLAIVLWMIYEMEHCPMLPEQDELNDKREV